MFTPFLQLRIHFKMWLLHRAIRSLEMKVAKPAVIPISRSPQG